MEFKEIQNSDYDPPAHYDCVLTMPSEKFARICHTLSNIGTTISISCHDAETGMHTQTHTHFITMKSIPYPKTNKSIHPNRIELYGTQ